MSDQIFKNDAARERMAKWYLQFLERVDAETDSIEVPTSHGPNHVLLVGDATKPPLVCLHAMLTSSAHLASELGALLDRFHLILPDLPGQSMKGLPMRFSYKGNDHAEWLKEILDGLDIQKPPLLGVSLGGFVARQFTSSYPDRVTALILIVPAGIAQGSLLKGFTKMAWPMMMYKLRPTEERLHALVKHLITTWDEDWVQYMGDAFNDFIPNMKIPPLASAEELKKLDMPCLVIGAEDDISFPGKNVIERAEAHIANVETELIENAKHSPPTTPEFRSWLGERVKQVIPVS